MIQWSIGVNVESVFVPPPVMLMKGVQFHHLACPNPPPDFSLWDRWVDYFSPNIRVVVTSMVPNLIQKALVLACTNLCR